MSALYLVRHGQASFGSSNYDVLSETGIVQAQVLGRHLAAKGLRIGGWVSGTLQRQRHTAEHALTALGDSERRHEIDPRFDEFDHTLLAARILPKLAQRDPQVADYLAGRINRREHFQQIFEKTVEAWTSGEDWGAEVESWTGFAARVTAGIEDLMQRSERGMNWIVVTSGGPITAVLAQVLELAPRPAFRMNWQIVNASITKIQFSGGGARRSVGYFNNYSYLQDGADRRLITLR